jgi:Ca-activated chloride channel homolog
MRSLLPLSLLLLLATASQAQLTVEVRTTRDVVPLSMNESLKMNVLATVRAPEVLGARAPVDCVVVLDTSGSMADEGKLKVAQTMIEFLVTRALSENDRVALVSFSESARTVADLVEVSNTAKLHTFLSAVYSMHAAGGTALSDGLMAGFRLLNHVEKGRTPVLLVLSDGQANEGLTTTSELRDYVSRLLFMTADESTTSTVVHAVAVGKDVDSETLGAITEVSDGTLTHAQTTEDVPKAFGTIVGVLTTPTMAHHVEVVVTVDGTPASAHPQKLGAIHAGAKRDVLLSVEVPPSGDGKIPITAFAFYTNATTGERLLVSNTSTVLYVSDEEFANSKVDPLVRAQELRVDTVKALKDAHDLFTERHLSTGKKLLEDALSKLKGFDPECSNVELCALVQDVEAALKNSATYEQFCSTGKHTITTTGAAYRSQRSSSMAYASAHGRTVTLSAVAFAQERA